jgi:hypothetical protein
MWGTMSLELVELSEHGSVQGTMVITDDIPMQATSNALHGFGRARRARGGRARQRVGARAALFGDHANAAPEEREDVFLLVRGRRHGGRRAHARRGAFIGATVLSFTDVTEEIRHSHFHHSFQLLILCFMNVALPL